MASDKNKDLDVGPKPRQSDLGIEIGVETNLPFSVPYSDGLSTRERESKALRELLRSEGETEGPTVAQLVAMRRTDGQARALYRLLTLPIRAALTKSSFVPAEGGEEEAEFITNQFFLPPSSGGMSVTFHRFMSQLLQALFDGFAPFEQVYDIATHGPLKGKYVLRKLAYRQPSTITFIEDEDGHFQGFRQRAYKNGEVIDRHIPRSRAFYFAAQEEERKYYGVSFFQSAFYHYDKKVKMYYIAHLAAQRAAVGTRVGTHPNNASREQKSVFAQNLSNLAVAQWMMLPENFKVEMLKESGHFDFLNYINHHNNQMSKSILASFFDEDKGSGSNDSKVVSFGQAGGDSMFILMRRAIMDEIANSINHYIIPRLIDWNFNSSKYPQFRWAELSDEQEMMIGHTFERLATAGESVNVSEEFLREIEKKMADEMGLEIDWDEVEEHEKKERIGANFQQGLDEDGMPLPVDAAGQPIIPGRENPQQSIEQFEQSISTGVELSSEEGLLQQASALLSLAGERIVRTEAGEERYGVPIGKPISSGVDKKDDEERPVTIERLQNLRAQYNEYKRAGNDQLAKKTLELLRHAVYDYTGSWKPSDFLTVMNKLSGTEKPEKE